jgi:hypothetical protein
VQFHYAYKCATSDLEHTMIDCEDLATPWDEGPEGEKIEYLDRQRVQCPANKVSALPRAVLLPGERTHERVQPVVHNIPPA